MRGYEHERNDAPVLSLREAFARLGARSEGIPEKGANRRSFPAAALGRELGVVPGKAALGSSGVPGPQARIRVSGKPGPGGELTCQQQRRSSEAREQPELQKQVQRGAKSKGGGREADTQELGAEVRQSK